MQTGSPGSSGTSQMHTRQSTTRAFPAWYSAAISASHLAQAQVIDGNSLNTLSKSLHSKDVPATGRQVPRIRHLSLTAHG